MKAQREHWSKDGSNILKFVSLAGFAFVKIRMQTMSVQISKREQQVLRWLDNQAVAYTVSLKKSSVLHYVKIIKFESLRKWHTFSF